MKYADFLRLVRIQEKVYLLIFMIPPLDNGGIQFYVHLYIPHLVSSQ